MPAEPKPAKRIEHMEDTYESRQVAAGVNVTALGDSSLTSFMGRGNARFDPNGRIGNSAVTTRASSIAQIRQNVLQRMDEVNRDAKKEADNMVSRHRSVTREIISEFHQREDATREKI